MTAARRDDHNGLRPVLTVVNAGGHLSQALCVMTAVPRFELVTTVRIDIETRAERVHLVPGTQFNPFVFAANVIRALGILASSNPRSVFSTGGPVCLPFAVAAKLTGRRFVYLDTLSRVDDLSNTARLLYRLNLADKMLLQWEHLAEKYPRCEYVGKVFDICDVGNEPLSIPANDRVVGAAPGPT